MWRMNYSFMRLSLHQVDFAHIFMEIKLQNKRICSGINFFSHFAVIHQTVDRLKFCMNMIVRSIFLYFLCPLLIATGKVCPGVAPSTTGSRRNFTRMPSPTRPRAQRPNPTRGDPSPATSPRPTCGPPRATARSHPRPSPHVRMGNG